MRIPRRPFLRLLVAAPVLALASGRAWIPEAAADSRPAPPPFVIIVNPSNPYVSLEQTFVADAFLKKTTRWPNGEVIRPVDLPPDSPTRDRFSNEVLKRSVSAVKSYWEQVIFAGRDVPPPELANDDEVVKYVLGHAHAIGYVSGTAHLNDARVVTVR